MMAQQFHSCVSFSAAKVENVHISLEDILIKIGQASASKLPPIERLFQIEIDLANALMFDFRIELFHDVLYGFSLLLAPTYPSIFDTYTKTLERLAGIYHLASGWWLAQTNGTLLGVAAFSIELISEQRVHLESVIPNCKETMSKIEGIVDVLLKLPTDWHKEGKNFDYKRIAQQIASCRLMEKNANFPI